MKCYHYINSDIEGEEIHKFKLNFLVVVITNILQNAWPLYNTRPYNKYVYILFKIFDVKYFIFDLIWLQRQKEKQLNISML